MRLLITTAVLCAAASPASAQPFANARHRLANYAVADSMPRKACESLAAFKGEGIVSINGARRGRRRRTRRSTAASPASITPEVAFEVNLPDRWNRRFYMTGNGGLAGDALDAPTNADRTSALDERLRAWRGPTPATTRGRSRAVRSS